MNVTELQGHRSVAGGPSPVRHVQQLQREEEGLRRRDVTDNTNTLTPAEQLMGRESELQRPTPLPNRGLKGDLVEHELP